MNRPPEESRALSQQGLHREAEQLLRDYLLTQPDDPEARRLLGEALWAQGEQQRALAEYRRLVHDLPDHPAAHYNLGTMAKRAASYGEAESALRRAVELQPGHVDAHYNLANLLQTLDRPAEAEAAYRQVLELTPEHLPAWCNLGACLQQQNRNAEAHRAYRRALELDPADATARGNLEHLNARLLPDWHLPMLADFSRNQAYDLALKQTVEPGSRVLDIGTGSGLLAMMAARAGAAEVYACEMLQPVAEAARDVIRSNGLETRIRVLEKKSTQLRLGEDLPGPADLLVSEIVDVGLLGEGVIPTVRHARAELLREDAKLIPAAARVHVSLAELPRLGRVFPPREISGFRLDEFGRFCGLGEYHQLHLNHEPHRLLSHPVQAWQVDFHDLPPPRPPNAPQRRQFSIPANRSGKVNALVFWFELDLNEHICISTAPDSDLFCWGQAVQFQAWPREVQAGQSVDVLAEQSDERLGFFLPGPR